MSVSEADKVDIVASRPGSPCVVLVVADHLPWDDLAGHMTTLQAKLNTYIDFIESGQVRRLKEPPIPPNPELLIRIAMRHAPPPGAQEFFTKAAAVLASIGVGLEQRVDGAETN